MKRFVGPQYLVEPPSIEGTFEESQTLIRLLELRPESALAERVVYLKHFFVNFFGSQYV